MRSEFSLNLRAVEVDKFDNISSVLGMCKAAVLSYIQTTKISKNYLSFFVSSRMARTAYGGVSRTPQSETFSPISTASKTDTYSPVSVNHPNPAAGWLCWYVTVTRWHTSARID